MKKIKSVKQGEIQIDVANGKNVVVILPRTYHNHLLIGSCMITGTGEMAVMKYPYITNNNNTRNEAIKKFVHKLINEGISGKLIIAPCFSNEFRARTLGNNIVFTRFPLGWHISSIIANMFELVDYKISQIIAEGKINWIRSNQEYEEKMKKLHDDEHLQL